MTGLDVALLFVASMVVCFGLGYYVGDQNSHRGGRK